MAKDFKDFLKALREMENYMKRELIERIADACLKVEAKAKEYAPHKTGSLRRSIQTKVEENRLTGKVGTNLFYAVPLEFGATIKPKNAKALFIPRDRKTREAVARYGSVRAFIRAVGGKVVYRKNVALVVAGKKVVGSFWVARKAEIKPREFFKKAYEEVKEEFPTLIFRDFRRILKG